MLFYALESHGYTEIAALEDVEKGIEFCRNYGVLPGEDLVVTSSLHSKVNCPYYLRCRSCNKKNITIYNT